MAEVADEAYIKRCINCGRKITKPTSFALKNVGMRSFLQKSLVKKHK
ncbi:MAG: hypothetical protein ACUVTD_06830 [Nitrososphaerales archaeon]